jgi:LemA protein
MIEWIVIAIVVIFILLVVYYYNALVGLNNQAQADWKLIEPLLQQRLDTIPNLVEVAKRVMKQEKDLFIGISKAREEALKATGMAGKIKANQKVGTLLGNLYARAEAYPEMKSNQNMQVVMEQISGIEDKIKYGRQTYQYTVQQYINMTTMIPGSLFAPIFGFKSDKWPYFEADKEARNAPDVAKLLKD